MTKYTIFVNINNSKYVYNVDNYEITDDGFIRIFDNKIGRYRSFDTRVCEIVGGTNKDGAAE